MTPRRGLLVGLIFVVIAIVYWGVQRYAGWPEDWAGVTMLLCPGRGDVDHDLRAARRPPARLTIPVRR